MFLFAQLNFSQGFEFADSEMSVSTFYKTSFFSIILIS